MRETKRISYCELRKGPKRGAETDAVRWTAGVESPVSKGNARVEAPIGARDEADFLLRTEERNLAGSGAEPRVNCNAATEIWVAEQFVL